MYKYCVVYIIGCFLLFVVVKLPAQDFELGYESLRKAELKRAPWPEMEIKAKLAGKDKRGKEKTGEFRVFFKNGSKTLAGFVTPIFEKGNLLLMVGDDLWYYVKETRRPTRITPIQRLAGAVSYGDLARLSWTLDYEIESMDMNPQIIGEKSAIQLNLVAKTSAATYQKIKLWIENSTNKPILSEVFLLSGKHFKTIEFTEFKKVNGKEINTMMKYTDHLRKNESSILMFTDIAPRKDIPDKYFIKTYLPDLSAEIID